MKTRSKSHGFTLPELMITMGVIAILLSVAVPSMSNMVKDNRLSGQLNSVMADIHLARSEAVKRDVRVILCRSVDPDISIPTCSGAERNWSTGYLVFTGEDGNNTYQAGTDTLIRRGQPAQEGVKLRTTLVWNNNLEINPNGTLNEGGTATMAMCDDRGKTNGRQITIPLTGIPRMYSANIASCTP
jgi:type IV fimbrial biogenesis protein FimT